MLALFLTIHFTDFQPQKAVPVATWGKHWGSSYNSFKKELSVDLILSVLVICDAFSFWSGMTLGERRIVGVKMKKIWWVCCLKAYKAIFNKCFPKTSISVFNINIWSSVWGCMYGWILYPHSHIHGSCLPGSPYMYLSASGESSKLSTGHRHPSAASVRFRVRFRTQS